MSKKIGLVAFLLSVSTTTFSGSLGVEEAWEAVSNPLIMSSTFERKFSLLPLQGKNKDEKKLWSGDYWAMRDGSINYRWNDPNRPIGFSLNSPTKEAASRMSLLEVSYLSPTEKYDLLTGRYDYPLKKEVTKIGDPGAKEWEGICHGWAPATINHNEPLPKTLANPDGILIPFGSSDIKALLSYYYAFGFETNTYQIGRRCFKGSFLNMSGDCRDDMNPGAFHIILANKVGLEGVGFIADIDRYKEVWNHPVKSYETKILKQGLPAERKSAPGTKEVVRVKTVVAYVDETVNTWQPLLGTDKQALKKKEYEYDLEIDSYGQIIGGEWKSKERPDFLWLKHAPTEFTGLLYRLGELLDD